MFSETCPASALKCSVSQRALLSMLCGRSTSIEGIGRLTRELELLRVAKSEQERLAALHLIDLKNLDARIGNYIVRRNFGVADVVAKWDHDHNGHLSVAEFHKGINEFGVACEEGESKELFHTYSNGHHELHIDTEVSV